MENGADAAAAAGSLRDAARILRRQEQSGVSATVRGCLHDLTEAN